MALASRTRRPAGLDVIGWIARRVLHDADRSVAWEPHATVGRITLLDHQLDAVRRLLPAIDRHGGALLADDVGLGKTYVALAIAARYPAVDIVAPAVLLPMWRDAVAMAGQGHAQVRSLHRFSRGAVAPGGHSGPRLVIVDEAHHLRTASTGRYRELARFVIGADVLLLSATPVHNRPADLAALLALFSGVRADQLDDARLAELVVRRRAGMASCPAGAGGTAATPDVVHHRHSLPDGDPRILEALRGLPPPLPVADGSPATALVRLSLLRAWCSSDAALAAAIRRRRLRGVALRQALTLGRLPSRDELRSWFAGEAGVQLGFVELLVKSRHGADATASFMHTLDAHLHVLVQVAELLDESTLDVARAGVLRSLLHGSDAPMVLFSQFAATARACFRRLVPLGGIGLLTGSGAELASGRISRQEVLARFAPPVPEARSLAEHARVRVLVATDLLAEGVNLQHAGCVVHLDLPWTDALLRQRVGRIARIGAPHAVVHSHTLEPPPGAAAVVRLLEVLARKASDADRVVGQTGSGVLRSSERRRASAVDGATRLRALLRAWSSRVDAASHSAGGPCTEAARASGRAILRVHARCGTAARPRGDVGLALVCTGLGAVLVALTGRESPGVGARGTRAPRWEATEELGAVVRLAEQVDEARRCRTSLPLSSDVARAQEAVDRWHLRRRAQRAMGRVPAGLSALQRRAFREIAAAVGECSMLERVRAGSLAITARDAVEAACGVGAEESLREWVDGRATRSLPLLDWLGAWPRWPLLRRAAEGAAWRRAAATRAGTGAAEPGDLPVIEALVLLVGRSGGQDD